MLRMFWSKDAWIQGDAAAANAGLDDGHLPLEQAQREETAVFISVVDAAVHRPTFWAFLRMLGALAEILRAATIFVEQCPCHRLHSQELEGASDGVRDLLRKQWKDRSRCVATARAFSHESFLRAPPPGMLRCAARPAE
eukprot:9118355-Alexandrium_andersonii.AAC.1